MRTIDEYLQASRETLNDWYEAEVGYRPDDDEPGEHIDVLRMRLIEGEALASVERGMPVVLVAETCGNPDFGQNPERPLPGVGRLTVKVADFSVASHALRQWVREHHVGGGNLKRAEIMVGNQVVAKVSYNGRVWLPVEWRPGAVAYYTPN